MTHLTPRQTEIAELVAKGMTNKAIARTLGISPPTVRDHISAIANVLPGDAPARRRVAIWFFLTDQDDRAA